MRRSTLSIALTTLAFAGCHCGQNGLLRTGPSQLQVCRVDSAGEVCDDTLAAGVHLAVDFGKGTPGSKVTRSLVLRAKGDGAVQLLRIGLVANGDPGFTVAGLPATLPYELDPGADLHLTLSFDAPRGGPLAAQLEVLSDFPTRPRDLVDLAAVGLAPRLCIDKADLDFGDVAINLVKKKTATLRSCGVLPLTITSLSAAAPFGLDTGGPALPQTLAVGATLPLPLAFKATAAGPASQVLNAGTNEPVPSKYALTGNGTLCTLDLSPGALDYGTVSTSVKVSKQFYLRSVGDSDCTVTAIRGPAGSPGFTLSSALTLPLVMPVGLEIPVVVDFLPTTTGAASATVQVDSNDSTLTTQTVALKAMSSGIGSNPIASGGTLSIPVKYAPSSSALHLGQLLVKYADQPISIGGNGGQVTVQLQGGVLAPKMCIAPTSLDFGAVQAGVKAVKSFTVSSCGDGALTVRGIALGSGTSGDFSLPQALAVPLTIAKGASVTINVQYLPTSANAAAGRAT